MFIFGYQIKITCKDYLIFGLGLVFCILSSSWASAESVSAKQEIGEMTKVRYQEMRERRDDFFKLQKQRAQEQAELRRYIGAHKSERDQEEREVERVRTSQIRAREQTRREQLSDEKLELIFDRERSQYETVIDRQRHNYSRFRQWERGIQENSAVQIDEMQEFELER